MNGLPDPALTWEVSVWQVAALQALPESERPWLLDCREEDERAYCQIAGSDWIPLGDFSEKRLILSQSHSRGVVVYCHHGMRSLRAAMMLREWGIVHVFSMAGGIEQWAIEIDRVMPRYG